MCQTPKKPPEQPLCTAHLLICLAHSTLKIFLDVSYVLDVSKKKMSWLILRISGQCLCPLADLAIAHCMVKVGGPFLNL